LEADLDKKDDKDNRSKGTSFFKALADFSNIGFSIAASVFVGVFLGKTLDNLLGTAPFLLLVFSLLGVGTAIKFVFDFSKSEK
jgi:ATP synthase protein I